MESIQDTVSTTSHVLWDWNGTLLDDAWLCLEIINGLLIPRGLQPTSLEEYRANFGFPVYQYYVHLGFDFERESFEEVSHLFVAGYHARVGECSLRSGVVACLEELRYQGLRLSVLSASRQDYLEQAVHHFGLAPYFESLNGIDTIHAPGKLERGRTWLTDSGYSPEQVVLVGDTEHDAEVASALGLRCFLLEGGHHSAERLAKTGFPRFPDLQACSAVLRGTPSIMGNTNLTC